MLIQYISDHPPKWRHITQPEEVPKPEEVTKTQPKEVAETQQEEVNMYELKVEAKLSM